MSSTQHGAEITPPLTVVCVTYNSESVLPACIAALPDAMVGIADWRLVVVDNDSADSSVETARRLGPPGTLVVELPDNRGYAAGINAGIAAVARPGHVLVINPDVRLMPGSVRTLTAALTEQGVGVVVPCLLDEHGSPSPSLRRRPTVLRALGEAVLGGRVASRFARLGEVVPPGSSYQESTRADWATGAAWLISEECRQAVGPWDESYFLYSEETDYALRAADLGFSLRLVPTASAVHKGGDQETAPSLWALSVVNRVRLHRRRHGLLSASAFRAALILGELLRIQRGPVPRAALRALFRPGMAIPPALWPGAAAAQESAVPWICFAAQDWWYHNRAHSDFQLMTRVARNRPVLLVNSIGLRMPTPGTSTMVVRRIARKARSVAKLVRRPLPDVPEFVVMTPLVVPVYHNARIRAFNAALVRLQVRLVAGALRIRRPVVFATIPTAADVLIGMRVSATLYNRSDRHSEFPEGDRATIEALETDLLTRADEVLYVSHELMRADADLLGGRGEFLDHGVDLEHFRRRPESEQPAELRAVPPRRIGFFGGLDDYVVDIDLIERVAVELPDCQVVLVGDATFPMERLEKYRNVHWFGFRAYEEIPAFGSAFDVAIMPWLNNDWIRMCNPIKLKEYLALGLPVVTTEYPEVDGYRDVVRVAADHEGFVEAVRATLDDGGPSTPELRRAFVADSSWDAVVARLERVADTAVRGRS